MTKIWKRVYKDNIIDILKELTDKDYQNNIWLNRNNPDQWVGSFSEATCVLFDDCVIDDYLKQGEIILDEKVTRALRELETAIDAVNIKQSDEDIFSDPLMETVRQKAAQALFLVNVSTYEGTTVDVAVPGQSEPLPRSSWP